MALADGTPSNDFSQYYLGAYSRTSTTGATGFGGTGALAGFTGPLGAATGNPLDTAGTYRVTSDWLAPATFPTFASKGAGRYTGSVGSDAPYAGSYMAAAVHTDDAYNRLTRTIDLTGVSAADSPTLRSRLLWSTEPGYDNAILEVHTVGADDWTTLPEAGGATSTTVPAECEAGFYIGEHPWLTHYLTPGADGCKATGTSGAWNSFTGASQGWQPVNFDLSAYAGKKVEVSLSYVTDPGSGGQGVQADETSLVIGGAVTETEGFETSLGPWTVTGPPAGSPPAQRDWVRTGPLTQGAVTTDDTVLLGFGLEHVTSASDRATLVRQALKALRR